MGATRQERLHAVGVVAGSGGQPVRRGPLAGLRSAVTRWGSREQLEAADAQSDSVLEGGRPCALLGDRHRVLVCGTLRSVTLRPRAGTPALEAEVFDGSGTLSVIWLGRRGIAGVEAGRRIKVEGLVSVVDRHAVMYNPRYELLPLAPASA
ncbi:OB-fold nucleic acid binding domain-containing protein [Pseudokineococcus sp. 1T1Z-3]|uniref:OB-fold nucleic acid binding domain-containing protein n=1 Tax=Pseudokineococcus sp. 1T1Z-3 TaxID=3132745 RepID=UPI0030AA0565